MLQRSRGKAINKHALPILPPRPPHEIRRVGVAMDAFDHHSLVLISRGEVSSDAAEAQPYLCYVPYRLHCISNLRDLAFFIYTFRCVDNRCVLGVELPCLCSTHHLLRSSRDHDFSETPSRPIIVTAVHCGHSPQYSRKKWAARRPCLPVCVLSY